MTIVNPLGTLEGYVPPFLPITNITPFTSRDGATYLEVLYDLRAYVNDTLVAFVNTSLTSLGTTFADEVTRLIGTIEADIATELASQNAAVAAQLATQDTEIATQLSTQNSAVAAQLATFVTTVNGLITEANTALTAANAAVTNANGLIASQNATVAAEIAAQNATIAADIATQNTHVDGEITDLTTYVNAQVAAIEDSSVIVSDPVMHDIIEDSTSASRELLDSLYAVSTGGSPLVSVKDHGAVGDGTTDDAAAINAAIAAAGTQGIVFFPAGSYRIATIISLPDYAHLLGVNPKTAIIKKDAGLNSAFNEASIGAVIIENLQFQGGVTNLTTGYITLNNPSSIISNCIFVGGANGIYLSGSHFTHIQDCKFLSMTPVAGGSAITVKASNNVVIERISVAEDNNTAPYSGIWIMSGVGIIIDSCKIRNCTWNLYLNNTDPTNIAGGAADIDSLKVTNSTFIHGGTNVFITGSNLHTSGSKQLFTDLEFDNCDMTSAGPNTGDSNSTTANGICVATVDFMELINIRINNCKIAHNVNNGIAIYGDADDDGSYNAINFVIIIGCTIQANTNYGVFFKGSTEASQVHACQIIGNNRGVAFNATAHDHYSIQLNNFANNDTANNVVDNTSPTATNIIIDNNIRH